MYTQWISMAFCLTYQVGFHLWLNLPSTHMELDHFYGSCVDGTENIFCELLH